MQCQREEKGEASFPRGGTGNLVGQRSCTDTQQGPDTAGKGQETESFPLENGRKRKDCPFSSLLFNIVWEVPFSSIGQNKEIKDINIGKEAIKLSLFADNMFIHIENPKESKKKP